VVTNQKIFDTISKRIEISYKEGKEEEAIELVESLMRFAYNCHPGRFYSEEFERLLIRINNVWFPRNPITSRKEPREIKKVLHIATTLYDTGGHAKILREWIKKSEGLGQTLLVIRPTDTEPKEITQACRESNTIYLIFDTEGSYIDKANRINDLIISGDFDLIVMHTHSEETVLLTVLPSINTPKFLMNHADHTLWNGTQSIDGVINIRQVAVDVNAKLRGLKENYILPLPVREPKKDLTKEQAKHLLGIKTSGPVVISVGSANKFEDPKEKKFVKLIGCYSLNLKRKAISLV
jgi:hypothetical protein